MSTPVSAVRVAVNPKELGLSRDLQLRDLWARTGVGPVSEMMNLTIKSHGARLFACTTR